ncbi:uncharacterized protein si:ch211-140l13.3 isoform X2 [Danio rerio]|uniref:Uncharacterized protein si:ch211-140l13.3 isoform X2 n=2 Tax=Danio rerio TaxID=7955 RepID=A0AC58I691_DANRE
MSAEIPRNRTSLESCLNPKTGCLESLQKLPMSPPYPTISTSLSQEVLEEQQISEPDRTTSQTAQHDVKASRRLPAELQVQQLQRVLQEQNTLLSLISPGLILSPAFLAPWQVQTPSSLSETDLLNSAGNSDAFKENLTKPTYFCELENESDALATENSSDVAPSAELRCLSPIKEESSDPTSEDCPLSPFGSRQGLLPNPEERPIRPGLRKEQTTFEEFVEEHLKTEQAVLQDNNQKQTRGAEKRNFLRKGEGTSRLSNVKHFSKNTHRRRSVSPQMRSMKMLRPTDLHQKEMQQTSDLKESLNKTGAQQDNDLSSNKDGKDSAWTANITNNANSPKSKLNVGEMKSNGLAKGNKSCTNHQHNSVGFKKINDHIIKVHQKNNSPPTNHRWQNQSGKASKEVNLTNEVMESLSLSDSDHSSHSEDGPNSQSHKPFPHHVSRHTDHKDQSLDLSDGDYASDAPSEIQFGEENRTSSPESLSSSSSSSDSELRSLEESNKTESRGADRTSAPQSLTKVFPQVWDTQEDTTHSVEQEKPYASIREEKEECNYNGEDGCKLQKDLHEPQELRQQIWSLKQQLMNRESQWSQLHSVLQSRVETLVQENQHLQRRLTMGRRSSAPPSYSTYEKSREVTQMMPRVRSATPAFNKPSIHRTPQENANGGSIGTTGSSSRRNSVLSFDNLQNKDLITQGGKGSSFYHHPDHNDAQLTSQTRKDNVREETRYPDGRVERLFWSGSRVIIFRNGTKKEISLDKSVTVTFFNGDVKRTLADGTVIYYYCDAQTTHSTYPSGLEVVQFPNNQREKHHPDGTREISFPDGTVKILHSDGQEESIFPDGTVVKISQHGEKVVEFTNGQREIHTTQYKRRIFPDGTIKTVYTNGRQETKFSSGRVRIKNNEGVIIMDKKST